MRAYLLFSILFLSQWVFANVQNSTEVFDDLLSEGQHLGVALGNHTSLQSLIDLNQYLKDGPGENPDLKYIVIEAPGVLKNIFQSASLNEFAIDTLGDHVGDFWITRFQRSKQVDYIVTELLSTVQTINLNRTQNPLIMVPIDGYNQLHQENDEKLVKQGVFTIYGGSNQREIDTATHFLNLLDTMEDHQKSIIIYHQAHILKGLYADGYLFQSDGSLAMDTNHLGWAGFVSDVEPTFFENFKIALIEEGDAQYNPEGVLDHSLFINNPLMVSGNGYHTQDLYNPLFIDSTLYKENSFLRRYRGGTVLPTLMPHETFEAVIFYDEVQ